MVNFKLDNLVYSNHLFKENELKYVEKSQLAYSSNFKPSFPVLHDHVCGNTSVLRHKLHN